MRARPSAQRGAAGADRLRGGSERDALFGGDGDDALRGRAGRDALWGGDGADLLLGGRGRDALSGGAGDDLIFAGAGRRDMLWGGEGDDRLEARGPGAAFLPGPGADRVLDRFGDGAVSYAGLGDAVRVDLAEGRATGAQVADRLSGIVSVKGGRFDDVLLGGASPEWEGFAGGAGADRLVGRGGYDAVLYHLEGGPAGVDVDLEAGVARDSFGDLDRLRGIEEVTGTLLDDRLSGGARPFESWRGLGGADRIDGRGGADRADYARDHALGGEAGIRADLARGVARDGWGDRDRLIGIENLRGGPADDRLRGDAGANRLQGGAGSDRLEGRGGRDRIEGGEGRDRLFGGAGADIFVHVSGDGSDRLFDFRPGRDRLRLEGQSADGLHELRAVERNGVLRLRLDDGERLLLDGLSEDDLRPGDVWLISG